MRHLMTAVLPKRMVDKIGRSFCLAVPELTRSADIKLNKRV
jgi:hypothetical protein